MRIIRGKYGRRRFDVPKNITARPTTDFARENLFNVLDNRGEIEDMDVLDLFAGTGAISWEFVSRGARSVTAVEQAQVQSRFIASVKEKLGDTTLRLIKGDVFTFLKRPKGEYDVVFADPPYDHPQFAEIPGMILGAGIVRPDGLVIVEHSAKHDFSNIPGFEEKRSYGSVNFSFFRVNNDTIENTK